MTVALGRSQVSQRTVSHGEFMDIAEVHRVQELTRTHIEIEYGKILDRQD